MYEPTPHDSVEDKVDRPLSFRLRSGVTCRLDSHSKPQLVLDFPLRSVAVHHCWRPLLERMATGDFVSLKELAVSVPGIPPEKTEAFLEQLVRKAYCDRKGITALPGYPSVTIVIPVRNRREDLAVCLDSLAKLRYPADKIEIIVVDDASSDDSLQVARRYPVKTVALKIHKQVSYCRNLAARQARGELLAFIDSDCTADPLWLKELVPTFCDPAVGAVGGMVDSYFQEKGLDRYEKVKSSLQVSTWFKRSNEKEQFFYVPSCNLLIRRNLFLELGGFREDLHVGEDVDLCRRLQNHGEDLEYRPVGTVYHKHRNRLLPFCRRRFQYGTSESTLQQMHPDRIKRFLLPLPELLFWVLAVASAWLSSIPLLFVAAAILLLQTCRKYVYVRKRNIPIGYAAIAGAVIRSSLSLFYHVCSFVSRYYLVMCAVLGLFTPWLIAGVLCMHGFSGMVEYRIRRPRLNPLLFLTFYSLEQISYQLGVWWGCLRQAYFKPLIPRPVLTACPRINLSRRGLLGRMV